MSLLRRLYDQPNEKDLVFILEDELTQERKDIYVHKIIMRAASPFFQRYISDKYVFTWHVQNIELAENLLKYFYTENRKDLVGSMDIYKSMAEQLELDELMDYLDKRSKTKQKVKYKTTRCLRSSKRKLRPRF
jgi:hypothetical protein